MKFVVHYNVVVGSFAHPEQKYSTEFNITFSGNALPRIGEGMPNPSLVGQELVWESRDKNPNRSCQVVSVGRYLADMPWRVAHARERILKPLIVVSYEDNSFHTDDDARRWFDSLSEALRREGDINLP